MIQHTPFLDGLIARMDDAWGYGKVEKQFKLWFDLEDVDGKLVVPKRSQNNGETAATD